MFLGGLAFGVTRRNLFGSGDCPTERQHLPSRSNIPKPTARLVPKRSRHRVATPRRLRFAATPGVRLRADFNIKQNQGRNWTVAATAELRLITPSNAQSLRGIIVLNRCYLRAILD